MKLCLILLPVTMVVIEYTLQSFTFPTYQMRLRIPSHLAHKTVMLVDSDNLREVM